MGFTSALWWAVVVATCLNSILLETVHADPMEVCQPRNSSYKIGDSKQCDKYFECTTKGKYLERLCPDGFVYSLEISSCEYPYNVNCTQRPLLQPSLSTVPQCPRSNGFYEFPAAESCQKFYHCLEGQAYEKTCPEGVIFDPTKGACVYPDTSKRPDCSAKEVNNFTCPNSLNRFAKLRFGDHDRHENPEDCRTFFICLKNGKPRMGGCPLGKVYNAKSGFCDKPKNVPNCKNYYGKQDLAKLALKSEDPENFASFSNDNDSDENDSDDDDDDNEKEDQKNEVHTEGTQPQAKNSKAKPNKKFNINA